MLDPRIAALTPWQRKVYSLAWTRGAMRDKEAGERLERMKRERPKEFEEAMNVWEEICLEVMN